MNGEAPWSENEQFRERAKACKSRRKRYRYDCDGSKDAKADYEGQCVDCIYDADVVLRQKYKVAP